MFVSNAGFPGFLVIGFVFYLLICIKFLGWCMKTARKVERSPIGFAWFGFFAPIIAWAILLTLNKDPKYGLK